MILFTREYHALNRAWFWFTLAESAPSKQPEGERDACYFLHHCDFVFASGAVAVLAHVHRRTALLKTNFVHQRLHRIDSTAMCEQPGISVPLLMEKASLLPNVTLN